MSMSATGREQIGSREWANEAVRRLEADANRSADTHLHAFSLPAMTNSSSAARMM
jgi:cysteine synthase A